MLTQNNWRYPHLQFSGFLGFEQASSTSMRRGGELIGVVTWISSVYRKCNFLRGPVPFDKRHFFRWNKNQQFDQGKEGNVRMCWQKTLFYVNSVKINLGMKCQENCSGNRLRELSIAIEPYCSVRSSRVRMANPQRTVVIRVDPKKGRLSEVRFWSSNILLDVQERRAIWTSCTYYFC